MNLEEAFKSLVWDALVKLAVSRLFAAIPFLAWGPVGVLVSFVAGLVADQLFDAVKMFINLQLIVLKNEEHRREFSAAAMSLKTIGESKGIDSEEFRRAREEHRKKLAQFVKFAV